MGFELEGLDELKNKLNDIARRADGMDGENEVPVTELCNPSFMKEHTSYSSFEDLLEDGGYEVTSPEDFEAVPDDEFDQHIQRNTSFDSWEGMMGAAVQAWAAKELGLG
jgi:hypothetical protein